MSLIIKRINAITPIHLALLKEADPDEHMINSYISRAFLFECLYNNKIVGILALGKINQDSLEILNISVSDTHQNKGIGSSLLDFADVFAKKNYYVILEVCTGSTSIWQLYFYQKHGFRIISVQPDYFIIHYKKPIYEHGIQLKDRLRLQKKL